MRGIQNTRSIAYFGRIETRNHFFYLDLFVICDSRDTETELYKSFPQLIIEILSPSTESRDRGDQFRDDQTLESSQEYVLINSRYPCVEVFRCHTERLWLFQRYEVGETFELKSINYTGTFALLYDDVIFAPPDSVRHRNVKLNVPTVLLNLLLRSIHPYIPRTIPSRFKRRFLRFFPLVFIRFVANFSQLLHDATIIIF